MKKFLADGASPDAVGRHVLEAVRENRFYIHTDRSLEPLVQQRAKAIIDAMPPAMLT